jgi:hypothetical protein
MYLAAAISSPLTPVDWQIVPGRIKPVTRRTTQANWV